MNRDKIEAQNQKLKSDVIAYSQRCNELEARMSKYQDALYMILAVDKKLFPAKEMRRIAKEVVYDGQEDER